MAKVLCGSGSFISFVCTTLEARALYCYEIGNSLFGSKFERDILSKGRYYRCSPFNFRQFEGLTTDNIVDLGCGDLLVFCDFSSWPVAFRS